MQTWQWKTGQGLPYLTCRLLDCWPHGFFTQQCWPRSPADLTAVLQPTARPYRAKQVHGNTVLSTADLAPVTRSQAVDPSVNPETLQSADGLFAEEAEQAVWVCSADCTPVLVADVKTGRAAAIHAGWRGTAARIVPQAIAQFQCRGSQLANLRVAMGPAIAGEVYQVAAEVAATVAASLMPMPEKQTRPVSLSQGTAATVLEQMAQSPQPAILDDTEPERLRLDVRRINAMQLEQLGLAPEQIAIAPYCTYQDPSRFFSYRRDGLKKVQWSGIVSL